MTSTASSFTACTFEGNEAQVRPCLTNRRLLKRTHTSILFLSLRVVLLVLLLSYSVVMGMLARLITTTRLTTTRPHTPTHTHATLTNG